MRRLLATDFGIWPILKSLHKVSDKMVQSPECRAQLANHLLMYDQLVIPTGNLQILPVLRLVLGEDAFDELIAGKGIVLARFDQWFGYLGNGGGLTFFQVLGRPEDEGRPNLGLSFFRPLDEAISDALAITRPPATSQRRSKITNLLLDNVINIPLAPLKDGLREETYQDVLGSPHLRAFLRLRNEGRSLNHLSGIAADQFKIHCPHTDEDNASSPEIHSVLQVAFENFLLGIARETEPTDITADQSTLSVLRGKGQRFGFAVEGAKAFVRIQELEGVRDVGRAFAAQEISPGQLMDLRHSKHCQAFRDWFAKGSPAETEMEIVQRYTASLGTPTWVDSLPMKMLRFAVATTAGLVNPAAGVGTSALDSLLLSKWLPGRSPRLFLREAKSITVQGERVPAPTMHGRDRNRLCPCGSGKKFKKCCGR